MQHVGTPDMHVLMLMYMHTCKQLPSSQSFDKQISRHQKGGGVSRWGEWVGKVTCLQV